MYFTRHTFENSAGRAIVDEIISIAQVELLLMRSYRSRDQAKYAVPRLAIHSIVRPCN